jgi:hypothetical protein
MGKKKKNKGQKQKRLYNKKEFTNIFCGECLLCLGAPTTCYNEIYKTSPSTFIKEIHPAIIDVKKWNGKRGQGLQFDPEQFRYAVCNFLGPYCQDEECKRNCNYLHACWMAFKDQIGGAGGKEGLKHRFRNKRERKKFLQQLRSQQKEKKKERYIVKPYATAFMSNNEAWKKVIKRMLSDGDNNREQNTTEAGSV